MTAFVYFLFLACIAFLFVLLIYRYINIINSVDFWDSDDVSSFFVESALCFTLLGILIGVVLFA